VIEGASEPVAAELWVTLVTAAVAVMYWTLEPDPNDGPMITTPIAATPTTIRATAAKIFKRMCAPFAMDDRW
jgi:hypothetical protein